MITATTTMTLVHKDEIAADTEDTFLYSVIRHQRFIELPWHALTEDEKRAIHVNVFHLYDY